VASFKVLERQNDCKEPGLGAGNLVGIRIDYLLTVTSTLTTCSRQKYIQKECNFSHVFWWRH